MSVEAFYPQNSIVHQPTPDSRPRYSRDDALSEREFEQLIQGANRIDDPYYRQQARFVLLLTGRLGLRVGELCHMKCHWIDWRERMIEIPRYQPCTKGIDGGMCGHCRQYALQRVEHNPGMSLEEAESLAWSAKTEAAARRIPFDFDPRTELEIERFFEQYDEWPVSRSAVVRRIDKAQENAPELEDLRLYPHCLRATAAGYHASRGLSALALQGLMGWVSLRTSQNYVRMSGKATARALRAIHQQ